MHSKILKKYILDEIIYFESEDLNFFIPYSSQLKNIANNIENEQSWRSSDPSISDKPMTVVIDAEVDEQGNYTGRVQGVYLFDVNINVLKTFEGDHGYTSSNLEYIYFSTPIEGLIESAFDDTGTTNSFRYVDGFQDRIIDIACQGS